MRHNTAIIAHFPSEGEGASFELANSLSWHCPSENDSWAKQVLVVILAMKAINMRHQKTLCDPDSHTLGRRHRIGIHCPRPLQCYCSLTLYQKAVLHENRLQNCLVPPTRNPHSRSAALIHMVGICLCTRAPALSQHAIFSRQNSARSGPHTIVTRTAAICTDQIPSVFFFQEREMHDRNPHTIGTHKHTMATRT